MLSLQKPNVESTADVAARLTDVALEVLARVGTQEDTVALELELWKALTVELDNELHGQRFARLHATRWLDDTLEQIIYRAALRVASHRAKPANPRRIRSDARHATAWRL